MQTNLSGVFYGMQAQIKAMLPRGSGALINIASVLGALAGPVAWLASDRASFVTGAFYPVDGGNLAR